MEWERQDREKEAKEQEEALIKDKEERLKCEASKDFREALHQNQIETQIEIKEEVVYDINE